MLAIASNRDKRSGFSLSRSSHSQSESLTPHPKPPSFEVKVDPDELTEIAPDATPEPRLPEFLHRQPPTIAPPSISFEIQRQLDSDSSSQN